MITLAAQEEEVWRKKSIVCVCVCVCGTWAIKLGRGSSGSSKDQIKERKEMDENGFSSSRSSFSSFFFFLMARSQGAALAESFHSHLLYESLFL
jgi:hypothetical protein